MWILKSVTTTSAWVHKPSSSVQMNDGWILILKKKKKKKWRLREKTWHNVSYLLKVERLLKIVVCVCVCVCFIPADGRLTSAAGKCWIYSCAKIYISCLTDLGAHQAWFSWLRVLESRHVRRLIAGSSLDSWPGRSPLSVWLSPFICQPVTPAAHQSINLSGGLVRCCL